MPERQTLAIGREVLDEFRRYVVQKHGSLRTNLREEAETALMAHMDDASTHGGPESDLSPAGTQ